MTRDSSNGRSRAGPFDSSNSLPEKKVGKIAYWMTEIGKQRVAKGRAWEELCQECFSLLDKNKEWQLQVLEHRMRWRGRSGKEFDHVYRCRLGPKEFGIEIYVVFECKAGFIKAYDIDFFYQKLINEHEFKDWSAGGLKKNVIPIIVGGKSAEGGAFAKASKQGMRIILHTSIEDVMGRLTGEYVSIHEIMKEAAEEAI